MLMQELGRIIQEDPNLCAMAMVDKRKYIISKWNASHSEPIDEDAVALFLCDENRGNLTDEQSTKMLWHCSSAMRTAATSRMSKEHLRKSAVQNLNSAIKLLCTDCFNAAR